MIEMIAMVTMLIDHIGHLFSDELWFRIIGRIAFPLYVYLLVLGYKRTSDVRNYVKRLVSLAFISQIPYFLVFQNAEPNTIFILLLCLFVLIILDKNGFWKLPLLVFVILVAAFFTSTGLYGIMITLAFRYGDKYVLPILVLLATIYYSVFVGWWIQYYSLIALIVIYLARKVPEIKINRTFYRYFYPGHLLILWTIHKILE